MAAQQTLFADPAIAIDGAGRMSVRGRRLSPFEGAVADAVIERGLSTCRTCGHLAREHYYDAVRGNRLCLVDGCNCMHGRPLIPSPPPEGTSAHAQWRTRWRQRIAVLLPHADRATPPNLGRADDVARSLARLWPIVREVAALAGPIAGTTARRSVGADRRLDVLGHALRDGSDWWLCSDGPWFTLLGWGGEGRRRSQLITTALPQDRDPFALLCAFAAGDRSALAVYLDLLMDRGIDVPPLAAWRVRP